MVNILHFRIKKRFQLIIVIFPFSW